MISSYDKVCFDKDIAAVNVLIFGCVAKPD